MITAAPAATKRPQHDHERAAYLKTRTAEIWVKGYVDKMNVMPAKRFVRGEAR